MNDLRLHQAENWARQSLGLTELKLSLLAGDASFRRYFRVHAPDQSWVLMDAPPDKEPLDTYLVITRYLQEAGVHAPALYAQDEAQGFLLLEDLGDAQYLAQLNRESADSLYTDAIDALLRIQELPRRTLPPYDDRLLRQELNLFTDWYLARHLQWAGSDEEQTVIETTWNRLIAKALEQPCVFVHRDYHSRNLMVTEPNPGVLDYQDAVWGPVSYDLVSLLRDCYIAWPDTQVRTWVEQYLQQAWQRGILDQEVDARQFGEWFDWMGVQRHLKAIGIFARLCHRDGKPAYLNDVPRIMDYVRNICAQYSELKEFGQLVTRLPVETP